MKIWKAFSNVVLLHPLSAKNLGFGSKRKEFFEKFT